MLFLNNKEKLQKNKNYKRIKNNENTEKKTNCEKQLNVFARNFFLAMLNVK